MEEQTRWHEAIDTMVTIDRAIEWNDSEEKYLYVDYNVLDLVNEKAPMSKLDAVEYVEDRLQSLLDAREEWYRLRDSYIDGLSEKQRDILEEEREISMTPIEKEYHEDFNVLHEYFNIVEDELANQKELLSLYREWRKLSRTQDADTVREFTDKHPVEFRIIFSIRDKGKDNKRKTNCNIDLVLRKWDITQTYKCPDNIIMEKRQQLSVTATP